MDRIITELGVITHNYFWVDNLYFRRLLNGNVTEYWNGSNWVKSNFISMSKAA
jgi:hypothetical protein